MRSRSLFLMLSFASLGTASGTVLYSNVTTFTSSGFHQGGATNIAGDTMTNIAADDIHPIASAVGALVTSFELSVVNFNPSAVTFGSTLSIWAADGAGGGPGTLLFAVGLTAITQNAGSVQLYLGAGGATLFVMPSAFWVGMTYNDEDGSLAITAAQLNNLGQDTPSS